MAVLQVFFNNKIYNLNGQVVKALAYKAEDRCSNLPKESLKYFVWMGIANSSLIHVFINPDTPCPPPPPSHSCCCRNLKAKL